MSDTSERRVILITGASRGIGLALAENFIEKGWRVVGCSRSQPDLKHENFRYCRLDIRDEVQVKEMFIKLRRDYGTLDALVNNAGISSMNHFLLTPLDSARRIIESNFLGTFLLSREAAKLMKKKGTGRIVNLTSVAVPLALEGEAVYASSKAAVECLTRILARELSEFGITVNALGPGPVETGLIGGVSHAKIEAILARQALHRLSSFADIANVVEFFLRPESAMVTGQVLYLGGI